MPSRCPLCAISCREQVQQCAVLINYLVGNGEYAWRNFKAERVRGPQIDDQLKFGRCLHRQVSWLVTFEDTPSVGACLMIRFGKTAAVADQTAGYGVLAKCVDCGYPMMKR